MVRGCAGAVKPWARSVGDVAMSHAIPPMSRLGPPCAPAWMALAALLACLAILPAAAEEPWGGRTWQTRPTGPSNAPGIYRVQPEQHGLTVFGAHPDSGYRRHYEDLRPEEGYRRHYQREEHRARDHGIQPPSAFHRLYDRPGLSSRPQASRRSWYSQQRGGDHWRNSPQSARRGLYGDLGWRKEDARRGDGRGAWGSR